MRLLFSGGRRWPRLVAGLAATGTLVAGVVDWADSRHTVPQVRLHTGLAWVASNEVGQVTLLDGASAEVVSGVQVAKGGSDLYATQQGATGYALDRDRGTVVRVDGATLTASRPLRPTAGGGQFAVFPTDQVLYVLDARRGLLTTADPKTLARRGKPDPLTVRAAPDDAVVDTNGRLWMLDERTGDLVWFANGVRQARAAAHSPGKSHLTIAAGRPVLLDMERNRVEWLDPETGGVERSVAVNLQPEDAVAASGSVHQSRLLISVSSQGSFLSCTTDSCTRPVALSEGPAKPGQAVEVGNHAVVPDYATGTASIIDLATSRVVARQRLFDRPIRFDLLARDGVIFYNDPNSEQAGVIDLDGTVRPISKYEPEQPLPADIGDVKGADDDAESGTVPGTESDLRFSDSASISVRPDDHGVVGDEFEFTVTSGGGARVSSARWTFDDGVISTGVTVRHRWTQPGIHPVDVAARLSQGQVVRATARVVVKSQDAPPHIDRITMAPDAPRAGQLVRIGAELTGAPPDRLAWSVTSDHGIETASSMPEFDYVFTTPGNYTVSLTVTADIASHKRSKQFIVAPAPHEVACGDTVTTDAVVTRDLVCTGVAITIAGDNVDLDLGGHTISTDLPTAEGAGIVIGAGRTIGNVTVRYGSVSRYPTGIAMTDVENVTVENVTVSASMVDTDVWGIDGDYAQSVQLRNVAVHTYHPLDFNHNSSVSVTDSILSGNPGRGVVRCGFDSTCVFEGGSILAGSFGCYSGDPAMASSTVSIRSNDLRVPYLGPYCETVTLEYSRVTLLADVSAIYSYLRANTITQDYSMFFWGSSFHIIGNTFSGVQSSGINIESTGQSVVSNNTFRGSSLDGVRVAGGDTLIGPLEITDNVFEGNGFGGDEERGLDGLRVESAGPGSVIKVAGNRTRNNARYGINAEPGLVIDGGGNSTSGDPIGCRGVVCLPE